jgi:hypothetical protein
MESMPDYDEQKSPTVRKGNAKDSLACNVLIGTDITRATEAHAFVETRRFSACHAVERRNGVTPNHVLKDIPKITL